MSRIGGLPDELLIKILSYLPTKVAVSTSILSKQWKLLWMWLPKIEYITIYSKPTLREFIDKNLPLHRAPVIESLRFKLNCNQTKPEYIKRWIEIAVSRHVRELEITYFWENRNIFPSSFYTCKSLVILKLEDVTLMDVPPSMVCLPSLKTLKLESVTYVNDESLQRLLSICPVLEDLSVRLCHSYDDDDNDMEEFSIIVPSLQRLSLSIDDDYQDLDRYVINTPCLKYFKLKDRNDSGHDCEIKNMPILKEAYVDVVSASLKSVVGSITSVKRLTLCSENLNEENDDDADYGDGFVFKELEHLNLCVSKKHWSNLLTQLLNDVPILRVLDISYLDDHGLSKHNQLVRWKQPISVPECLLSSLQIFKWSGYTGKRQDRDIAVYILKNARCLKTATILAQPSLVPKLDMIKELKFSSRASTTCELLFD
ncbi:unnamed protein product [Microthlaspi erraticum]|uniref:F-box domain-containing protein n=1 Tax=Microthlaspi erraticum TaxID=1685480 RepID=A0A6D2L7J2_9BRAS|nr:unnamed protein product [Microthlaspi erraticum]